MDGFTWRGWGEAMAARDALASELASMLGPDAPDGWAWDFMERAERVFDMMAAPFMRGAAGAREERP